MSAAQSLRAEAAERILMKDGAYGTLIQQHRLQSGDYCGGLDLLKDQRGNNDLLNITKPELVRSICASFAEAGADLLATNTFNANAISQADYGAEELVPRINRAAAEITREVADRYTAKDGKPRWVAGALVPTNTSPAGIFRVTRWRRSGRPCGTRSRSPSDSTARSEQPSCGRIWPRWPPSPTRW